MFRLRRAANNIDDRITAERSEVEDTKNKLLDTYRSQNEDLKKANRELQEAQDSFKTEKQELQGRIALLLGKPSFMIWFVLMEIF